VGGEATQKGGTRTTLQQAMVKKSWSGIIHQKQGDHYQDSDKYENFIL